MDKILELTEAMHAEKDAKFQKRLIGVRWILLGHSTADTSSLLDVNQRTVQLWLKRYKAGGIEGLRDAPRAGQEPRVSYGLLAKIALRLYRKNMLTPKKMLKWTQQKLGIRYSLENIRRILRVLGFSRKTSVTKLADAADPKEVEKWQMDVKRIIVNAKKRGFVITIQDESIFVNMGTDGLKLWGPKGERVVVERSGRRLFVVVYGTIAEDGTRLMRTYDKFNSANFVDYLEQARRKWGKVLMIMDNAAQHKSKKVVKYLEQNPDVMIVYLPVARPELSAIEAIWKQAKYRLITSEFYKTVDDLKAAVSEYFRTCSINIDIYAYLMRHV